MNQEGMNAHKIATGGRSECNVRADGEVWVRVNGRKSMETSSSSETINQSINSYAVFRNERTCSTYSATVIAKCLLGQVKFYSKEF
jgi:hypothetical protein